MNKKATRRSARRSGQLIAETAASLVFLLALGILVLFVIAQTSYCYLIKASLTECSRHAARDLAVEYGKNPEIAQNRAMQEQLVLDHVRVPNILINNDQFDDVVFDTSEGGRSVAVTVRFGSGVFGLPPLAPDVLNLGSQFRIIAHSTYRLE